MGRHKYILPDIHSKPSNKHNKNKHTPRKEAHDDLEFIRNAVTRTIKTKKRKKRNLFGDCTVDTDKLDLKHDEWEIWAGKHGRRINSKFSTNDIRHLRKWFEDLDVNKSGGVGKEELLDPLLSAGILKSKIDVDALVRMADTDGSGEIGFHEFLHALENDKLCDVTKISRLQNITQRSDAGLSAAMKLSIERRKHMMITVVDEMAQRQSEIDCAYMQSEMKREIAAGKRRIALPMLVQKNLSSMVVEHHAQKRDAHIYLSSLEKVIESQRESINADDVVSSTKLEKKHGAYDDIVPDESLDVGYVGGIAGRRKSIGRLSTIAKDLYGKGTFSMLQRADSVNYETEYSTTSLYNAVEVDQTSSMVAPKRVISKKVSRRISQSTSMASIGENSDSVPHDDSYSFDYEDDSGDENDTDIKQLDQDTDEGSCTQSRSPFSKQPVKKKKISRLNSKQLSRSSSKVVKTQNSGSILKLKKQRSVSDHEPKRKLSIIRVIPKTILPIDLEEEEQQPSFNRMVNHRYF